MIKYVNSQQTNEWTDAIMPYGSRSKNELQADTINNAIKELTRIRNELDPSYAPHAPAESSINTWCEYMFFVIAAIAGVLMLGCFLWAFIEKIFTELIQ